MATTTTSLQNLVNAVYTPPLQDTAPVVATQAQNFAFLHGSTPWEYVILAVFVLGVMMYVFTVGRDRIAGLFLSAYAAWIAAQYMPFTGFFNNIFRQSAFVSFISFVVLFVVIFALLFKSEFLQSFGALTRWWQNMIFTLLFSGLFVAISLSFLPNSFVRQLSTYDQMIFVSDIGRFCWIVLPIIAIGFFGSGRRFR